MPEYNYRLIRKLATTAVRLNKVLICAIFLNLLTLAACCWALTRVVKEERSKVSLHFSRLVSGVHQHEDFLTRIAQHGNAAAPERTANGAVVPHRLLSDELGERVYEGAEYSFSMPFTLAQQHAAQLPHPGNFALGGLLASFYSYFWSTSAYPSPQVFMIGVQGNTSMAVPAIGHFPALTMASYFSTVRNIYGALSPPALAEPRPKVRWSPARHYSASGSRELLAYLYFTLPDALWWAPAIKRQIIAASLLRLDPVSTWEQAVQAPTYDRLQLISPQGTSLIDEIGVPEHFRQGLNITAHGLIFKLGGTDAEQWVALYEVTYASFFGYAKWQVLGGIILLLASLLGSWAATRWYARKVIWPARTAHLEIVESDMFSRAVIQTAPVALCVLRREDRQLIMHNPLAERLLGGMADGARLSEGWNIGPDPTQPDSDVIFDSQSGTTLHGSFASARYRGQDVVLCAFNDISIHRQAEQNLAQAKRTADAASAAKSRFLATMSHEIRTPLYGALGTLELLGLTDLTQQQRHYHELIEQSSLILMQVVSDVLDVSKIEAGEMTLSALDFSPAELVAEVIDQYAGVAQAKGLRLQQRVDPEVPAVVRGDAFRIRQILTNLLSNALKFTQHGTVTVTVGARVTDGVAALKWQVIDTGIGIAASQQAHLFEPFYQAHADEHTVSGTGLGLSICAHLARLMGGQLEVDSKIGVGSRFIFSLDLETMHGVAPVAPAAKVQEARGKLGLSILVAEDNPVNQALICNQLEELGCRVTLAGNGEEALARWTPDFDVVLTDVNMPIMNGYQLVQALREKGVAQPIVAISASTTEGEADRFAAAGVSAWLIKPVSLRDLYEALRSCCPGAGPVHIVQDKAQKGVDGNTAGLSPRMRALFLTSVSADVHKLHEVGERRDVAAVVQQIHRLRGALAAVQARTLCDACEDLERRLRLPSPDPQWPQLLNALVQGVQGLLARIASVDSPPSDTQGKSPPPLAATGHQSHE